jgi:hypothetical protein
LHIQGVQQNMNKTHGFTLKSHESYFLHGMNLSNENFIGPIIGPHIE